MEKVVVDQLSEDKLREAVSRFQADIDSLRLISDVENFVYEGVLRDRPFILRLTHSSHRSAGMIKGELDWIAYLRSNGVNVPDSIVSEAGLLVERIDGDGAHFLATAFTKLPGDTPLKANACTPELYKRWGRVVGRMHFLARKFSSPDPIYRRAEWFENDLIVNAERYLSGQEDILEKFQALIDELRQLPRYEAFYGLIHADLTDVNFFVHDDEIWVFDFDDCEYHWFTYDIAVILFDSPPWMPREGMSLDKFTSYFWQLFISGYVEENSPDSILMSQVVQFMKLRQVIMYIFYHKKWNLEQLQDWQQKVLWKYKQRILDESLPVDINLH